MGKQGSSGFQMSSAWMGLKAPQVRLCTISCNSLNNYEIVWRRGVVCEHFSCRHLATQGAPGRPAGRRSVATQVNKLRPFGDASYLIEALLK